MSMDLNLDSIWIKELCFDYNIRVKEQYRKITKIEDSLLEVGIPLVKHHILTHPVV